ncbi:MAG: polyprenyl synthetase family protein, partial [Hyphomicrobium sp.]
MTHFPERLSDIARMVDARLGTLLAPATPFEAQSSGQSGVPARLNAAMRHAVLTGGKRFRPFLLVECAELFAVPPGSSMDAALALECIHCYSLAHDDLPCMDNDKLRRGQPTVWTAYDEWTAVLAGDALQTLAFEILTSPACHADAGVRCALAGAGEAIDAGKEAQVLRDAQIPIERELLCHVTQ